ncbi:DUF2306 domain-containing protein [Paenibacillus hexagrammi]|uniref:DUF2306 domain-containing protein n=1 Tax=Paenibacillus hexagrammi TaxID=2908839 RepID=A0ABY3SI84_9BACL|nr:DUF2306 domain-containing protein [Paenibacillus sp. YPD9-1]UJF32949.1 DUF2306 domain-containing protein [Paenibacillus sp. YPD9-1]
MGLKIWRIVLTFFAVAIAGYAIVQYGFFSPASAGLVSQKLRQPDFHLTPWVYVLYAHIVTAVLALVLGPYQLFVKPQGKRIRLHRRLGYVYFISIMVSSIVGLYLAIYATGGWVSTLGFLGLDLAWAMSTWLSVRYILNKNVQAHKDWMMRSYALTCAAITLRLWLGPMALLFGNFITGYQVTAWLCWVPNLFIMEAVIRRRAAKRHAPVIGA